jgi:hypothetical protein
VDFTITGGVTGKMSKLTDWHKLPTACSKDSGQTSWSAVFIGMVGADRMAVTILVLPYHGPGTYVVGPFDPSGTPVPVHVLLLPLPDASSSTTIPPPGVAFYLTEPNTSNPPAVPPTAGQRPTGQTMLLVNSDETSGQIGAPLYNWNGASPIRVQGSFNCGTLTTH